MDKPKIRFQGFEEAWCEKTLGEIAECNYGGGTPSTINKDYWSSCGLPWIQSSDLIQDDVLNVVPRKFITAKALKNTATKFIPSNSLAIVTRVGVGKLALIPFDYATSQDFTSLSKLKTDKYFSAFSIYTLLLKDLNLVQGTSIKGITKDEILQKDIFIPSLPEQKKIGKLFERIDHLLNLQQRKCDKLNDIKKSMLTKMFPKPGQKVPEVRFEGFTDDWVECKAEDLFYSISDKNHPDLPVLSATQEYGMVKREDLDFNISHDKKNESTYKRVKPGQFVIHLRSFQGGFAHSLIEGITSPAYTVIDFKVPEIHHDIFWKYIFNSEKFIKDLESVTYGIRDGRSISFDEFLTMKFLMTSYKEQKQIGAFFHKLDTLIRLSELRLDKLRLLKRSFLEGMFV
ncbi:restriction endonuclease subunit S [Falsiporphyromonas endometrii]|uniref:Restriction endonuclease subunit S n=1 Tax=Falsiporphyromonas endometrii TaxID=1387297 RepID=A0ABV9K5M0_9PORP